ncbi:bifunctional diguanylate cyclase/phosphodiesterase [Gilvimarinus algae]|uniref:EAL domain-containing protein n=1 Tax=Gilvimarinus algae TaxID=3058037 RepID=A0ABT8TC59_9GAMM|nr:EAL domain-containing protein [Gilvimarinus sp. SDUM040014]MDO3381682.1 EAL domain-containing protein [Gilvimarinus sp. SDUM040014]
MKLYSAHRGTPGRWALVTCLTLVLTLSLAQVILERYFREADFHNKQLQVTQQLTGLMAELSGTINSNLSLISGLAAHIGIHPDINQNEFEAYASTVFRQEPLLVNMAAAPNLILTLVYPLEQNRAALGLNYRENAAQWDAVRSLDERGELILAGPVQMVQGGEAVIGRVAVVTRDDRLWGIVSSPIYTKDLYREAGLLDEDLPIEVAIRGHDGLGSEGRVFFGDRELFQDARSILASLEVGSGRWQLAARPVEGWQDASGTIWVLRSAFIIVLLMSLLLVIYRYGQSLREQRYQQALQKNQVLLQEVGKLALVGGWQVTPVKDRLDITLWNEQTSLIFGLGESQKPPSLDSLISIFDPVQADYFRTAIINATLGTPFDSELHFTGSSGYRRWVRVIGKPLEDGKSPYPVLGSVQDITERKRFTDKIQQQAIYDQLTGLPNRLLFHNRLSKAIAKCRRDHTKLAVLFIDLDNFKPVNDNLGHNAGDILLKEVGGRIKSCIRSYDTVARYSGDEFIVILHDVREAKTPVAVAQQIIDTISRAFLIDGNQIFCGASIGISLYPDDGDNVEALVSNADQAMYEVKRSGRNGWQFFTRTMQVVSEKRHSLSNKLATAIQNNEFSVYYQPIVDLTESRIKKCEALVRWMHEGKQIPTDEFIGLAEETGRINEIDRFVLERSSKFLTQLSHQYKHPIGLSINVSPRVFSTKDNSLELWLDLVTKAARHLDITVEMTERLLIDESDRIMWVLTKLKALGVTIAIDDFGTGYSSLSYLTKFPIDIIKVDQSFVKRLGEDRIPEALTETMITLSHKLSLEVVAEGVETAQQLAMLKGWHCDYGQGYYFDKPLAENEFSQRIRKQVSALQI